MGFSPNTYELLSQAAVGIAAILMASSALWPPLNWRRTMLALLLFGLALVTYIVDELPALPKPLQLLVIAECEILDHRNFLERIEKVRAEATSLSSLGMRVTDSAAEDACTKTATFASSVVRMGVRPSYVEARRIAKEYFETYQSANLISRWIGNFATKRVVFAHAPGGALDPSQAYAGSVTNFIDTANGSRIELIHAAFGVEPITELVAFAMPPVVAAENKRLSVYATLRDRRLDDAAKVKVTYLERTIGCDSAGNPSVNEQKQELREGSKSLDTEFRDSSLGIMDVHFKVQLSLKPCTKFDQWIALEYTVEATTSRDIVSQQHTLFIKIVESRGLTLVSPGPSDPRQQQLATPGWEPNAAPPGNGLNIEGNSDEIINAILGTIDDPLCDKSGKCLAVSDRFVRETRRCWFRGREDISNRYDEFKECLKNTERLALIAPDKNTLDALEAHDIAGKINTGKLHALVAAPAYENSGDLPSWVPIPSVKPTIRSEPRVHFSISRRESLRRKTTSSRSPIVWQREFLSKLAATYLVGPSGEKPDTNIGGSAWAMGSCAIGGTFGKGGGLAWFKDPAAIPVQAPDTEAKGFPAQSILDPRLKGVLRDHEIREPVEIRASRHHPGRFMDNVICNSPALRLFRTLDGMKQRQEFDPPGSRIPRAAVGLFADVDLHVSVAGLKAYMDREGSMPQECQMSAGFSIALLKETFVAYFAAGGNAILIPVQTVTSTKTSKEIIQKTTASPLESLADVAVDIASSGRALSNQVSILEKNLNESTLDELSLEFIKKLASDWAADPYLRSVMVGDGFLSDRRDKCFPALSDINLGFFRSGGCSYSPGDKWATALTRLKSTPEQTMMIVEPTDALVSGKQQLFSSDYIAASMPYGLGRVTSLGYSPFARDQIGVDLTYRGGTSMLDKSQAIRKRSQCYYYLNGRNSKPIYQYSNAVVMQQLESPRIEEHGGMTLLQRFVGHGLKKTVGNNPEIVLIDVEPITDALIIDVRVNLGDDWTFQETGTVSGEPVNVQIIDFDRSTLTARLKVDSDERLSGNLLKLDLFQGNDQPVLIPVNFKGPLAAEATLRPKTAFDVPEVYKFNSGNLVILSMLIIAILMFCPPLRRWPALTSLVGRGVRRGRRSELFTQTTVRAPLFSLEAGLSEWGLHPGTPAAISTFGLPAGFRPWRSGDSGGAILPATLFALVSKQSGMPRKLPTVRLRTSSQAVNVLVLVEASGALRSPNASKNPPKALFTARLGTFIAQAIALSHGVAEVRCCGQEPFDSLDPQEMETKLHESLMFLNNPNPPVVDLENVALDGRLVYYLIDGLSANAVHLLALADLVSAEGGSLRVAAVCSDDDRNAIGLRRDPLDGRFDDDTETHPKTIIVRRDKRLNDIGVKLARRQALMLTLDTGFDTSKVIEQLTDTGFFR